MGSTRLWFPSRKSVDSQRGGLVIVFEGHCRSGRFSTGKGLYLVDGSLSLAAEDVVLVKARSRDRRRRGSSSSGTTIQEQVCNSGRSFTHITILTECGADHDGVWGGMRKEG